MKRVIITGASEGLGFELSKLYSENGWSVLGISRHKPEGLKIDYIESDLTSESELEKISTIIHGSHPKFDLLINCAGMLNVESFEKINYRNSE